jgi:predicted metal-dependent HD superfamily phosphohydrolase
MNACELLSEVWRDLTRGQACTGPAQAVLDELVGAYSEPHRHYHTIEHVASLLRLLDEHGRGVLDHRQDREIEVKQQRQNSGQSTSALPR